MNNPVYAMDLVTLIYPYVNIIDLFPQHVTPTVSGSLKSPRDKLHISM
jgi:hypothetical protein